MLNTFSGGFQSVWVSWLIHYVQNMLQGAAVLRWICWVLTILAVTVLQGPVSKSNLARFVWNVMALDTSRGQPGDACDPFKKLCADGQVGASSPLVIACKWQDGLSQTDCPPGATA